MITFTPYNWNKQAKMAFIYSEDPLNMFNHLRFFHGCFNMLYYSVIKDDCSWNFYEMYEGEKKNSKKAPTQPIFWQRPSARSAKTKETTLMYHHYMNTIFLMLACGR